MRSPWILCLLGAVVLVAGARGAAAGDEVRVTVAVILATTDPDAKVDPRLKAVAEEVRKTAPRLKGFRMATTTSMAVPVGGKQTFPLVDDQTVEVHVLRKEDRVCLKVKAPVLDGITYTICCGKFLPLLTGYHTKDKKERLIVAVMVSPCPDKKCDD